eukprot:s3453_g2.t1
MGSSADGNAALPPVTPEASVPVVAAVLGAPAAEGIAPDAALPSKVNQVPLPDSSKGNELSSPLTPPKRDDVNEEDLEATRAAKRQRLEEIDNEMLDDRATVLKCLHHVASLEYTARQAQTLKEWQE